MKQIAKTSRSIRFWTEGTWILNRLGRVALGTLALFGLALAAASAHASCGPITITTSGRILPALAQPGLPLPALNGDADDDSRDNSIVGLWHTTYSAGGAVFAESFKQWHSDGTELDNIDQNPAVGSICLGVWKPVGARRVRLHHVGWVFAPDGSPSGSFTIDEEDTVAPDGKSYIGTFTFRVYDVNWNFTGAEVKGTIAATRITVD